MCSHYLIDPVACTPASGWEKGQVENQEGLVRERFFTPRLRFKNLDALNAWLLDQCITYAKAHRHPELTEQTIWEVFEAERPKLVPYAGRFDGFHAVPASVSKTCLVRFDNNTCGSDNSRLVIASSSLDQFAKQFTHPVLRESERIAPLLGRPIETPRPAADAFCSGFEMALAFDRMQHGVQRTGAHPISMMRQFLDHPVTVKLALHSVVQDVQPDQSRGDFLMLAFIDGQGNILISVSVVGNQCYVVIVEKITRRLNSRGFTCANSRCGVLISFALDFTLWDPPLG